MTGSQRIAAAPTAAATSARGKLLRKLDAVSVRIEDVEQAHLAVQLDDDADLDALGAQPLGLRLQIVHVDVRHTAVPLRLALRETDVHLAVPQLRPAGPRVDGGLRAAEGGAGEPARPGHV